MAKKVKDLKEKEFFLVELNDYVGLDQVTVRELRDTIVRGLESGLLYVSIMSPEGVNRAEVEGHTTEDIEIDEFIEVIGEDGKMDIMATADAVTRNMLLNGMIIVMRDKYEFIDEEANGCWIDKILKED